MIKPAVYNIYGLQPLSHKQQAATEATYILDIDELIQ